MNTGDHFRTPSVISPSLLERHLMRRDTPSRHPVLEHGTRHGRASGVMSGAVTLRPARASDAAELARLEDLDGRRLPAGDRVVAIADGRILAAAHVPTGTAVADPFEPSANLVALAALHARQLRRAMMS